MTGMRQVIDAVVKAGEHVGSHLDPTNGSRTLLARTNGEPGPFSLSFLRFGPFGPNGEPAVVVKYYELANPDPDDWTWELVYFFDANGRVHCCDPGASQELNPLDQTLRERGAPQAFAADWHDGCAMLS